MTQSKWLNSWCLSCIEDDDVKVRQFTTPGGDCCEFGHGGSDGRVMSQSEIQVWKSENPGKRPPVADWDEKGDPVAALDGVQKSPPLVPGEVQTGDVLWLKSGGNAMTVERVFQTDDGEWCASLLWFDDLGTINRQEFGLAILERWS